MTQSTSSIHYTVTNTIITSTYLLNRGRKYMLSSEWHLEKKGKYTLNLNINEITLITNTTHNLFTF